MLSRLLRNPITWLCFLFILTRLFFLTKLAVFNDEAIYLDWGWSSLHEPNNLFYSLYDGKQPVFFWLLGLAQILAPSQPLLAGRLVGVFFGAASAAGTFLLTRRIADAKTALFATLLYIVSPLFVFFDRQALAESAIVALTIWSAHGMLQLIDVTQKTFSLKKASVLSFFLACGIAIKSSFMLSLLALTQLTTMHAYATKKRASTKYLLYVFYIAVLMLLPLLLQQRFWQTLPLSQRYTFTVSELLLLPFGQWLANVRSVFETLMLFTPIAGLVALLANKGSLHSMKDLPILLKQLFFTQMLLLSATIFLARGLHPRYIVSAVSFLPTITAAMLLHTEQNLKNLRGLLIICLTTLLPLLLSSLLVVFPLQFFSAVDRVSSMSQKQAYVTNWTAGYAATQAANFISAKSAFDSATFIAMRTDAGNPESAVRFYFQANKNFKTFYFDELAGIQLDSYACLHSESPVFFVSRDQHLAKEERFWQETARFFNPGGESSVGVYTIKQPCEGKTLTLE